MNNNDPISNATINYGNNIELNAFDEYFVTIRPYTFVEPNKRIINMEPSIEFPGWYDVSYEGNKLTHFAGEIMYIKRCINRPGWYDVSYEGNRLTHFADEITIEKIISSMENGNYIIYWYNVTYEGPIQPSGSGTPDKIIISIQTNKNNPELYDVILQKNELQYYFVLMSIDKIVSVMENEDDMYNILCEGIQQLRY